MSLTGVRLGQACASLGMTECLDELKRANSIASTSRNLPRAREPLANAGLRFDDVAARAMVDNAIAADAASSVAICAPVHEQAPQASKQDASEALFPSAARGGSASAGGEVLAQSSAKKRRRMMMQTARQPGRVVGADVNGPGRAAVRAPEGLAAQMGSERVRDLVRGPSSSGSEASLLSEEVLHKVSLPCMMLFMHMFSLSPPTPHAVCVYVCVCMRGGRGRTLI